MMIPNYYLSYSVYIILGILPSIIWLFFYLRKDQHPEPKRKVLEVFFGGILAAVIAAGIEIFTIKVLNIRASSEICRVIYLFLGVALIEECLKYLVAEERVFRAVEFDEPVDSIIYLIVAGLGFAALENVFLFFSENLQLMDTFLVAGLRFVGATLLHALTSGILGYFIALSFLKSKSRSRFFLAGLLFAVLLHGIYNFFIMKSNKSYKLIIPAGLLLVSAIFLSFCFKKIKKIKSVCETTEEITN